MSDDDRTNMLPGSANGARCLAVILWTFFFAAIAIDAVVRGYRPAEQVPAAAIVLVLGIRPWFMGIYLLQDQVLVKSWFRNYRFSFGDIAGVSHVGYSGMLNRWSDSASFDLLGTWTQVLELRLAVGKRRAFPATINSRRRMAKVVQQLRAAAGITSAPETRHSARG